MALNIDELDKKREAVRLSLTKVLTPEEAVRIHPLKLAWIGDGIFSDLIRKHFVLTQKGKIGRLHRLSTAIVQAKAQAGILALIDPELTLLEKEIVRRGRNTTSHVPKSSTVMDYRYATAFETLLGYLKLTGQDDRIIELCSKGLSLWYKKTATLRP